MANKEQTSIEEIIAMMKIAGLGLRVYPQKLTTAKGFAMGDDVTPEFVTNFDIETLVPKVSIKYYAQLRRGNCNGTSENLHGKYYFNESSSIISLEKAVRNAWRAYLKEMELRNR